MVYDGHMDPDQLAIPYEPAVGLPDDPATVHGTPTLCMKVGSQYPCTRLPNHGGRHAFGDGVTIKAVWA